MAPNSPEYLHGHHESVLRSHRWRTAKNSAAYLLDSLRPDMHILDIGCGPGTITIDLALLVPDGDVVGLDASADVLNVARASAKDRKVDNVSFVTRDILKLDLPDASFDLVCVHQVLQHLTDPIQALREMRRVTKPGGIVAAREVDFAATSFYPDSQGLSDWLGTYLKVARSQGFEPNAGRRLHAWANQAGFERADITCTTSTWCFQKEEERAWWSGLWSDRMTVSGSSFARLAVDGGFTTQDGLQHFAKAWQEWGADEDGWTAILHGEIRCRVI